ncbi:ATP-binding protein [Actinoplanes sp. NPDC051513]|uniref:ATP-binding protein n=1 Tax=Actinoplanes sp. NPDC051513 TaxID=3363908 RepID=UPI0037B08F39
MNLKRRVAAGFGVLCVLFLALVVLQLVVGDRVQARHEERLGRIERLIDENRQFLQSMTDAETGVRGFQLTGKRAYLMPYDSGRAGAFVALNRLDAADTDVDRKLDGLVSAERAAADRWLYAYAIPIVNAGVADADAERAARGKVIFDQLRAANRAVSAELDAGRAAVVAADRRDLRRLHLLFGLLAVLVIGTGLSLAWLHERHLVRPLEHIRHTLRRLADGERSARARAAGPPEMRAVIGTLNDLAAETERLITAEQARAATGELRQRVAAELRSERDPAETGHRVARILAESLGGDAAYGKITVGHGAGLTVSWPPDAPPLDPALVRDVRAGGPYVVRELAEGLAVALSGDDDCAPGLLLITRAGPWSETERDLLENLGREIDHTVRQARLRLRQSRLISELRVLDEQKDVFVSTVTHELRTPLTSILGYTEMLTDGESGDLSPAQQRGLSAILRNAHRLQATVADLLLLDRGNEHIGTDPEPVDLATMLTGVHDDAAPSARAKNVAGLLEAAPVWVRGDPVQLERALRKLVDNAIKFTPAGGRFELRLSSDGANAVITVTDTGMGIPADDLPGLFTPFHRAANAMDQAVQGPGLGLAIVRNIVLDHGGTVSARSELGNGSTFTVTLPALIPAHASSV